MEHQINSNDFKNGIYNRSKEEKYWLNKFSGELSQSNFPCDFTVENNAKIEIGIETFVIKGEIYDKLMKLSNNSDFRLYIILLAGMYILMERYIVSSDVTIGTTILKQDVEADFVNTILALRNTVDSELTFKEFLLKIQQDFIDAIEHQNYSIETLLYKLDLTANSDEFLLFSHGLILENIHDKKYLNDLKLNTAIVFNNSRNELLGKFSYNTSLYERGNIKRIIEHYNNLLEGLLDNIDSKISQIEFLTENEKNKLLNEFNDPIDKDYSKCTIVELFEKQAEIYPNRIACEYGDLLISYSELNKRANLVANILMEKGVRLENIVGILMDRSVEMIISILGVIKAGGTYLTIDTNYPENRIKLIINESKSDYIIIENESYKNIGVENVILYNELTFPDNLKENANRASIPEDLLYVIFTSGSTGKPKGVLIENRGCVNMVHAHKEIYMNNQNSRMSQVAGSSFDAMSIEIWPCLTSGASLCIANDDIQKDPFKMKEWLIMHQIQMSYQPTYMTEQLLEHDWDNQMSSLQFLKAGGDRFRKNLVKDYPFKVHNHYGPSEDSVWTTYSELTSKLDQLKFPVIGKPIKNKRIYIINDKGSLQPIGIEGELCISGFGLAREYLNDERLTKEKFVTNLFDGSKKLYKTGDMARWLPDGNLEFIERKDRQVKIRGYRIELKEIELCLKNYPEIDDVIVIDKTHLNGDKYLCAYYKSSKDIPTDQIREYLSNMLPDYMIPVFFVRIDNIPLTFNGKVDRRNLPEPVITASDDYAAPRDELENMLVKVFQKVLNVEKIGITDNFFMIGGDSIKAIQISSQIFVYGYKLEIKDIFVHPQIKELKNYIKKTERKIPQGFVKGELPLTPIIKWCLDNFSKDLHHFNQSIMLLNEKKFDEEALNKALNLIINHHDALRIVFKKENNEIIQYNRSVEGPLFDICIFEFNKKKNVDKLIDIESNKIQASIDLENGPLVKLGLFKTSKGDHLLITIHHYVIDGVSWRIIIEDFILAYEQALQNKDIKLQNKTDSFKYWAEKLQDYALSEELLNELEYWKKIDQVNVDRLVPDYEIQNNDKIRKHCEIEQISLDEIITEKLIHKTNWAYNTEINDILLTALGRALNKVADIKKVLINLEGHGRENFMADINVGRTVGWFTSQYPVVLDMKNSSDISYNIRYIKETLRKVPNKGIGYGILKYLTSSKKEIGLNDIPDISFNYLGEFGQEFTGSYLKESPLSTGKNISDSFDRNSKLEINSVLTQGVLTTTIEYNKLEFSLKTMKRLSSEFKNSLIEIIEHCCGKDKMNITPNDLGYDDMSLEELGQLEDFVSKI